LAINFTSRPSNILVYVDQEIHITWSVTDTPGDYRYILKHNDNIISDTTLDSNIYNFDKIGVLPSDAGEYELIVEHNTTTINDVLDITVKLHELDIHSTTDITSNVMIDRNNIHPSTITYPNGRSIVVYEKQLTNSELIGGSLTSTSGSTLTISSGTAKLHENLISWNDTQLELPKSTFCVITVDETSNIQYHISPYNNLGGILIDDVIDKVILGWVNIGSDIIVNIDDNKQYSSMIYIQAQSYTNINTWSWNNSNSGWHWNNIEYRLNLGTNPYIYHDETHDLLYISYTFNMVSCLRILDIKDYTTFGYIPQTYDVNEVRYLTTPLYDLGLAAYPYIPTNSHIIDNTPNTEWWNINWFSPLNIRNNNDIIDMYIIKPYIYNNKDKIYNLDDVYYEIFDTYTGVSVKIVKLNIDDIKESFIIDREYILDILQLPDGFYEVGVIVNKHSFIDEPYTTPKEYRMPLIIAKGIIVYNEQHTRLHVQDYVHNITYHTVPTSSNISLLNEFKYKYPPRNYDSSKIKFSSIISNSNVLKLNEMSQIYYPLKIDNTNIVISSIETSSNITLTQEI